MVDRVVDLEWLIGLAQNGDGQLLAEVMRRTMQGRPLAPALFDFVVKLVGGQIRLTPRKRTVVWESERWWQERRVAFGVEIEMSRRGKQRDKNLRAALTREACEFWGTDPAAVGRFLKHNPNPKPRRRLKSAPRGTITAELRKPPRV